MDVVNLKGFPVRLKDDLPAEGIEAEDFYFVKGDLNEDSLFDHQDEKARLLVSVPSMDTGIGVLIAKKMNEYLKKRKGVFALLISKDLPFAIKRVFDKEKITTFQIGSDFRYGDFGDDYGVEMLEGALRGLLANSVVLIDKDNKIVYSELVQDIFAEPDYESVFEEVDDLLK